MPILIITEKTSQARDLRSALGDRFEQILPAEGHLLRLALTLCLLRLLGSHERLSS